MNKETKCGGSFQTQKQTVPMTTYGAVTRTMKMDMYVTQKQVH